jgi:hypothetical protein
VLLVAHSTGAPIPNADLPPSARESNAFAARGVRAGPLEVTAADATTTQRLPAALKKMRFDRSYNPSYFSGSAP